MNAALPKGTPQIIDEEEKALLAPTERDEEAASEATRAETTATTEQQSAMVEGAEEEMKGAPQVFDLTDSANVPLTNLVDPWKEEHGRKCEVFNAWCRANGVKQPKVDYPAYFEGGLVGVKAIAPIEHREAFLGIPYKMLMTVAGAQAHPILGPIIAENPQVFSEEEKGDWEQLTLVLFMIYEH